MRCSDERATEIDDAFWDVPPAARAQGEDAGAGLSRNGSRIRVSEDLGFASTWLAEHHFSRYGLGSATLTLAAYLAGVTKQIRIGTAMIVLPFYDPITLAEEAATIDLLSGGRFEFGMGRGYQWGEFHQFNLPLEESRARFDEAVEIMKQAWTEDEFDYHGRFWTFNQIKVLPKPKQKPHPPLDVAASTAEGYRRAAGRGDNPITGGSTASPEQIRANLALYRQALEAAGHADNPAALKVTRPIRGRTKRPCRRRSTMPGAAGEWKAE